MTVFPVPTLALSKNAGPVHPTPSAATTPLTKQFVSVALVVPSYALFAAVIDGVTVAAEILAVVVAVVDERM